MYKFEGVHSQGMVPITFKTINNIYIFYISVFDWTNLCTYRLILQNFKINDQVKLQ